MKLEDQVCSLELAKKLKELGVKQESLWSWCWEEDYDGTRCNTPSLRLTSEVYGARDSIGRHVEIIASAFTVAELGEMLKESEWRLPYVRENGRWWTGGFDDEPTSDTEADARAKMLVWVMECELKK